MRDIFNLLKHEGHELKVIEYDNNILLGCKTCGVTLYSLEDFDVKEFTKAYETIEKEAPALIKFMKNFIDSLLLTINTNVIVFDITKELDSALENYKKYEYSIDCASRKIQLIYKISNQMFNKYNIPQHQATSLIKLANKEIIENFNNQIKETLANNLDKNKYLILDKNVVYSCYEFTIDDLKDDVIEIIFKEEVEKEEKINPTPTNIIKLNNVNELCSVIPDYDNEESMSYEYNEYQYRLRNGLYDISDIKDTDLLDILIDFAESWEYYDRYTTIGKVLKKRLLKKENQ